MDTTTKILDTLRSLGQTCGALTTIDEQGKPHAAAMWFVFDDNLNFYFVMRDESKKYHNIQKNPNVAFVVTSITPPVTVQVEGAASQVSDPHEESEHFMRLIAAATTTSSTPAVAQMENGKVVFMKLTPSWIRVGNFELSREGEMFIESEIVHTNSSQTVEE